jgi:hypothetical protein
MDGLFCQEQPTRKDSQSATAVVVIPAVRMVVRDQDRALAFFLVELVAFLMSDAGACINGQVLYVDGGTILS